MSISAYRNSNEHDLIDSRMFCKVNLAQDVSKSVCTVFWSILNPTEQSKNKHEKQYNLKLLDDLNQGP